MIDKIILKEIHLSINKKIQQCLEFNNLSVCNWDCCTYSGSYILLFPGEFESAIELGYDMSGYEIIDENYYGGMKIVPKNKKCTICMDENNGKLGYKPLDCIFYPFWPKVNSKYLDVIAGELCPIINKNTNIEQLIKNYIDSWEILCKDEDVNSFLQKCEMVGYKLIDLKKRKILS